MLQRPFKAYTAFWIHHYVNKQTQLEYIYIYIERERERERLHNLDKVQYAGCEFIELATMR